jgi:uncharacterized phage protein gp47/JayE
VYQAKSAEAISKELRAYIRDAIPGADASVWPNNLYVVVKVVAQGLRGLYLRLEWLHRQIFASLAEGDYLDRHGADFGMSRMPKQQASGDVVVSGDASTFIPAGTRFVRGDRAIFISLGSRTIATSGTAIVSVYAEAPGREGNTDASAALTLQTAIPGVDDVEVDDSGITGGSDVENDASLRSRILDRKRNPPQGGSPAEYIRWARLQPYVTRVFVKRATPNPGDVTVYFMTDDSTANGIPTAGQVAEVEETIEEFAPANAQVIVAAPTPLAVDITIDNLAPSNARIKNEIEAELKAMFRRRAVPDLLFSLSWIEEAISSAAGEHRHVLVTPTADINPSATQIPVLGTISYT